MIKRTVILIFFVTSSQLCNGQDLFYKIYTLGFHQTKADELLEQNGKIYVTGMAMDTTIKPTERNLHLSSFTLDGESIKSFYWDNPNVENDEITMDRTNFHFLEEEFIIPYAVLGDQCTISIDSSLNEASLIQCYTDQSPRLATTYNSTIWNDNKLVVLNASSDWRIYLTTLDLDNPEPFELHDVSPDSLDRYYPKKAFDLRDGTLAVFGAFFNSEGSREDHKIGLYRVILDQDYNVQNFDRFGSQIIANVAFSDWLIDSDGYLMTLGTRFDYDRFIETGLKYEYPILAKIDPVSLELVWEAAVSGSEYLDYNSYFNTIIETHEKNGYIVVGAAYESGGSTGSPLKMIYGNVSKAGEINWYKELSDSKNNDGRSGISAGDVIATSDGYYMACGNRSDLSPDDGIDSRAQAFLVKFDEDGELLNTSSTTDISSEKDIRIFPNPANELITVSVEKVAGPVNVRLTDIKGQLIYEQSDCIGRCEIDVSQLGSGNYIVLVSDNKNRLVFQEMVFVE